ncbi:MAG: ATP-binding protein [Elusimicrobiota bacterium]
MTDRRAGLFRSSRLSWNLLAAVVPTAILMVAVLAWLQYGAARRQILLVVDEEVGLLAEKTAANVDDLLAQRSRDLFTLADSPLIADYYRSVEFRLRDDSESYRAELEQLLRNFAARTRVYSRILYLDARGRAICRAGTDGAEERGADFPIADFAAAQRAPDGWWVSPIEKDPKGNPVLYYAKPVRNETGKFEGMLVLGYDLDRLRGILEGIRIGAHGGARIDAPDGIRLEGRRTDAGSDPLTASHPLTRLPWSVVVSAPSGDFLSTLTVYRNAAVAIALGGGAMFVVFLLMLVRSITRPIEDLVVAARAIGRGDLSHRAREIRTDELGELSTAFNEMAEHLDRNRRRADELQSQLVQSEKLSAVGQLIAAVAHELNNPLAAVSGHVQISQRDSAQEKIRLSLGRAYDNILRCRKVVDNLLFFVRKSGAERRKMDVNAAARSAADLLEYRLLKTDGVRVALELAPAPVEIDGDFSQIVQILVNLIGNACDAMETVARYPEGKRLTVRSGAENGKARISIEDNGSGFEPGLGEKLFQPFYTTKEAGRGTGLGLPVSRQIAREHGGELSAEGRPGRGSVFHLDLPLRRADAPADEDAESAEERAAVPGRRVLVADDEADVADVIASLLREDGDEVVVVHQGEEAAALLRTERFDLVVTDVHMGSTGGVDLYESISAGAAPQGMKILFVTGDVLNSKLLRFFHETGSPYVAKPFDIHELQQAMRRLLAETKPRS